MKKKLKVLSATALILVLASLLVLAADPSVKSLRGDIGIDAPSQPPQVKPWLPDSEPIARDFIQQPPLIPHHIKGYAINLKFNKCLTCHSWANYKQAHATKVPQSHFKDRDGNDLANVSGSRYFCTQCHVPQHGGKPLVKNDFRAVEILQNDE